MDAMKAPHSTALCRPHLARIMSLVLTETSILTPVWCWKMYVCEAFLDLCVYWMTWLLRFTHVQILADCPGTVLMTVPP